VRDEDEIEIPGDSLAVQPHLVVLAPLSPNRAASGASLIFTSLSRRLPHLDVDVAGLLRGDDVGIAFDDRHVAPLRNVQEALVDLVAVLVVAGHRRRKALQPLSLDSAVPTLIDQPGGGFFGGLKPYHSSQRVAQRCSARPAAPRSASTR
jgi:hypothetical protein